MKEMLTAVQRVIDAETAALQVLQSVPTEQYAEVIAALADCKGKVVFMGVGKSAHIGKKLAATFASTGTPAFFVHSTEAVHGDFGMIEERDVVILISNSGNTGEVVQDLPSLRKIGCKTIAMTSGVESALAKGCDLCLFFPKLPEADAFNLAPTVSTTMTLALGDAIAIALSEHKKFSKEQFHIFHPGGALGKRLLDESKEEK